MDDVHQEGGKFGDDEAIHHDSFWETVGAKKRVDEDEELDFEGPGGVQFRSTLM
jgi:hypothetical protein